MEQATIYSSDFCGYCHMAKQLLAQRGIPFHEITVDDDPALRAEMTARSGRRTTPQIFFGERHVGGFDDLAALDRSGGLRA